MNEPEGAIQQLSEQDILLAIAQAQGVLTEATIQIMKRNKYDGLRAAAWLKQHSELYHLICNEFQSCCGGSQNIVEQADKIAKEP